MMSEKMLTLRVLETAIACEKTKQSVKAIKAVYRSKLSKYFQEHGEIKGKFEPDNPECDGAIKYTNGVFNMLSAAKRDHYNAKRRHERAVNAYIKYQNSLNG